MNLQKKNTPIEITQHVAVCLSRPQKKSFSQTIKTLCMAKAKEFFIYTPHKWQGYEIQLLVSLEN